MKGSIIASQIDEEYRRRNRLKMEKDFIREYCNHCINRNTALCDIRRTVNNDYKCVEYKENRSR